MLAGVRRLPRLACALAQRRHYLSIVLHGGDGAKPIALKLSVPWGKSPLAKPLEELPSPILRVLTPSASSFNNSRVIITLPEETGVTASVELLPKPMKVECDSEEGEEEHAIDTSDEEDEWDDFYPTVKESSGDALMGLFYQGGETEEDSVEETVEKAVESTEMLSNAKCFPSSSLVIDLCIWPRDSFANATIHEQGNRNWRSSWSFNLGTDSKEISDSLQVQGLALSPYHDQPLEYRGVICGSILDKFKISLDTHYDMKEMLGSGARGQVYRCESLDNPDNSCAIKWITYENLIIQESRESLIMKNLCHPNVKRFFCAWKEQRKDLACHSVFLAHELCKCTLEDHLDETPVIAISDRIKIFIDVVSGVKYLHSKGIVHRDIKCSNIFVDDQGCAKVGDFGESGLTSSRSCSSGGKLYGTRLYGAPELLRKKRHGVKSDIFSLGVVYAELFGPANVSSERFGWLLKLRELISSRQWKRYPFSTWKKSELSKDFTGDESLMIKMLEWSPEERPSCAEILEVLAGGCLKPAGGGLKP